METLEERTMIALYFNHSCAALVILVFAKIFQNCPRVIAQQQQDVHVSLTEIVTATTFAECCSVLLISSSAYCEPWRVIERQVRKLFQGRTQQGPRSLRSKMKRMSFLNLLNCNRLISQNTRDYCHVFRYLLIESNHTDKTMNKLKSSQVSG